MAEITSNQLNVRIQHKYDTYEDWMSSTLILNAGELAICEIPQQKDAEGASITGQVLYDQANGNHLMQTPPAIGIKVGDGSKTFKELPWIQAVAGDVHAWAKKSTLEWADLTDTFKSNLSGYVTNNSDTDTTYEFAYENGILKVYWKNKADAAFTHDEAHKALEINLGAKMDKVAGATAGNLAQLDADGQVVDAGVAIVDYYKKTETIDKDTFNQLEQAVSGIDGRLGTAEGKISTLEEQIKGVTGAMHFRGELILVEGQKLEDITTGYENGDVVLLKHQKGEVVEDTNKEYVWVVTGTTEVDGETVSVGEFVELGDVTAEGQRIAALEDTVNDEAKGVLANSKHIEDLEKAVVTAVSVGGVAATVQDNAANITSVPVDTLTNKENHVLILNCGTAAE